MLDPDDASRLGCRRPIGSMPTVRPDRTIENHCPEFLVLDQVDVAGRLLLGLTPLRDSHAPRLPNPARILPLGQSVLVDDPGRRSGLTRGLGRIPHRSYVDLRFLRLRFGCFVAGDRLGHDDRSSFDLLTGLLRYGVKGWILISCSPLDNFETAIEVRVSC
jgi:hypothetical protein